MKLCHPITIHRIGDNSISVSWPNEISETILREVLLLKRYLTEQLENKVLEIVNCYQSLMIYYDPLKVNASTIEQVLKELINRDLSTNDLSSKLWRLPVCYDQQFGIDLELMAKELKTEKEHIIQLHAMTTYTVYFLGFLPGFMYLGGLNEQLSMPRKKTPRSNVPSGSVAIGGSQTGVYPRESPAGWHIIGNCPVPLFQPHKELPCFVSPGDRIKFEPVEQDHYQSIRSEIMEANYSITESLEKWLS